MTFMWSAFLEAFPSLLPGAKLTLLIALVSLPAGMLVGTAVGVILTFAPGPFAFVAKVYVGLIRGTPMVVQIMFIYFALPIALGVRLPAVSAGVLALVVNSSAYLAEIVRGGLLSVPKGLGEAGLAMGLPLREVVLHIVGPVAFRRMIPALGNQFIIGLKDTSLLIIIGVGELTRTGQEIMTDSYRAVEVWCAVAIIYLGLITVMAGALRWFEKRLRIG
jgi:glutamine transport system permease protein